MIPRVTINQTRAQSVTNLLKGTTAVKRMLEGGTGIGCNMKFASRLFVYRIFGIEPQQYAICVGRDRLP